MKKLSILPAMFWLKDYSYTLPEELIAQDAMHPHHDARMMIVERETWALVAEDTFFQLGNYLPDDRVLFFNDSRVIRSRIPLYDIRYVLPSGKTWALKDGEIFYLRHSSENTFEALVRPGNKFKVGSIFHIGKYRIIVQGMTDTGRILNIEAWTSDYNSHGNRWGDSIENFLAGHGQLPLPPYIRYSAEKEQDYQTSFARKNGSVAAPTASLHFTEELLAKLPNQKEYLTLHVGLGTFKWIQTEDIRDYAIHGESVELEREIFTKIALLKSEWKKIVAVGTTACRTLESLPYLWEKLDTDYKNSIDADTRDYWDRLMPVGVKHDWIHNISIQHDSWNLHFETRIYITPGYQFHLVDDLITNFHLPESSLIVLVSAFLGYVATRKCYEYAIQKRYRFYSFGDGMYIRWKN